MTPQPDLCRKCGGEMKPSKALAQTVTPGSPERVYTTVRLDLLIKARDLLRECGEDLVAAVDARYPPDVRKSYPTEARRRERDRLPGIRAMALADCLDADFGLCNNSAEGSGGGNDHLLRD